MSDVRWYEDDGTEGEAMITRAQLRHLRQHEAAFVKHAGSDLSIEEYFAEFEDEYPDLYERVCRDLGLEPVE